MVNPTVARSRAARPSARPYFSSGPCAKPPGWSPEKLDTRVLGRSHRSALGKARLAEAIDRTHALLGLPQDYRLGIVPASDTGAMELAMWSLLGTAARDDAGLGKLRRRLGDRRRQAIEARRRCAHRRLWRASRPRRRSIRPTTSSSPGTAPPAACAFPTPTGSPATAPASPSATRHRRRSPRTSTGAKIDVGTFSWQKALGGEGGHGMIVLSPRAVERLEGGPPAAAARRSSA